MSSLDEYLAAHEAQAATTRRQQPTQQQRRPLHHARSLSTRSHHSIVVDENDAPAVNGVTLRSSPSPQPQQRAGYQTVKSRLLSQSGKISNADGRRTPANTATTATQKPLLVKSVTGGFTRRPSSAASVGSSSLTPRSRRAAVNAGMSARDYDALHSPSPQRLSPAKTGLYPAAGTGHSRRTSSVSFAASTFGSPAADRDAAAFHSHQPQQQQQQQQSQQHAAFVSASPSGWFSPARSQRGHAIPLGSDHVPWRPAPDASSALFNAAESSPVCNADRARFQADVERAVFTSPPRDSSLNAPNFATRRFSSPPAIAGAPPTVFHSPLSASWIQALRARTARIMHLASTNAAASGKSPPFDPRAAAAAQAHSPFDPHAPSASSASLARTRDRIAKQNLIFSPSILRGAPDGGQSLVSTPGTPSLDSRGNTPPPAVAPGGQQRFAGMGAGLPAFMLRSPTILARHRAAVVEAAAASSAAASASAAAGPAASASARQEAHQTLLAQNPQRQQLLEEFRQGLREMEMGATSALQSLPQQPQAQQQQQPAVQPFTSQILPVPIVAARPVQSMESLPAPQPMHRSSPPAAAPAAQARGHSVATSPMTFASPARSSPSAQSQQQQSQQPQHASPFVHRMIGSSGHRRSHGHAHDDDECDECATHAHHHHALAPRARRDVQTSPLALMPAAAAALPVRAATTTRSAMTSPMPQQQQFGSPLRVSPLRSSASVAPSVASFASSTAASSLPSSAPTTQPLSLADRINSNLAGLRQLNLRANHIAARSPAAPAATAQALPNDTTTIPAAHDAHRNVLQRIDRIVNLTKQPVVAESQKQQPQQQPQQQTSFFPAHSERSFLSLPTPAALSGSARSEAKYPDPSDPHHQPLLHDISELTNSAMEDSRGDSFAVGGGGNKSFQSAAQSSAEAQDQERFRLWQQRLAQNQHQLQQQQQQQAYSAPPLSFAPQSQQHLQHLPPLPSQPPHEPVFHSDGISDALAQSLRNIQSLRSSLANSRGLPLQQQQYSQSQPAPTMQARYAPNTQPFAPAYSATAAHGAPFATAHLHPYAASEPHAANSSSDSSGGSGGVRLEFHQVPHAGAETSIRVGAALVPEIAPPLPQLLQPAIGWTLPGWMKQAQDSTKADESQPQRRASIATTCSDDLSPARAASSLSSTGSSRTATPPSPSPAAAATFVPLSPPPSTLVAAAPRARLTLQPFTPIAASGIFAQAFRCMALEHTPAATRTLPRTVQPSPQQAEIMQNQQRHNASTLSQLNRQE